MNNQQVETCNPSTGKINKVYTKHSKKEAEALIEKSYKAYLKWHQTSLAERAKIIESIAQKLHDNKMKLARMMAYQMGKPISQGEMEIDVCIDICKDIAQHGPKLLKSEKKEVDGGYGIISYEPLGVILSMQPWNYPCYQVIRSSIANIMAGNATVFKHAPICWETATTLKEIFQEAGLPEHVFTVLYVDDETADELIAYDKIVAVSFTGSAEAGKIVGKKAGEHIKKSVLELGGSDPYIILEDASIDNIINTCIDGRINNAGQTCTAAKRFIILAEKYEEFKQKFVHKMEQISYGDPLEDDADMGPLARKDLRERLHQQVQESIEKGAKLLCGGKIPHSDGYFYPATVLENIPKDSPAYKDELFGPVAVLFKAESEDDAIRIANDHRYGLGGGIFSGSTERAINLAHRINTGMVNVNGYNIAQPNMPFGGIKESGFGREHGEYGIMEFINIKSIVVSD
ncbi:aldehyde dehydrogenase [Legionella santicrucis]|uniref:Aldehyde dehydrogenase n=2 Tax=Legionella santicrucis TaxID=45074 RepID=A0A0W0YJB5_9GAMM|nr:aldehyde dehydrogenase [Legionella santicrucis]